MPNDLVIVSGCNASGKSTFIRSRMNELDGFEIIMPDVYKANTRDVIERSLKNHKDIVFENLLRDKQMFDWIEQAKKEDYRVSLILAHNYHNFERAHFLYTGNAKENELIMSFDKGILTKYNQNNLTYIQKFFDYVKSIGKDLEGFDKIKENKNFTLKGYNPNNIIDFVENKNTGLSE